MDLNTERVMSSSITLANATDLTTRVVMGVAGDEVAASIEGCKLTQSALRGLVLARMQSNLTKMKPTSL